MSKELINAAVAGNVNRITILLDNPDIDINYLDIHDSVDGTYQITPLVAALRHGKWEVAKLLIERGAKLEKPDHDQYKYEEWYAYPFIYGCTLSCSKYHNKGHVLDVAILKLMLARVRVLNPDFGTGQDAIDYLSKQRPSYILYFFHEAILRYDIKTIESIYQNKLNPELSLATMTQYIAGRTITANDAIAVKKAIDWLVEREHILRDTGDQIKGLINKNVKFVVALDVFPNELRNYLRQLPAKGSLSSHLAELFYKLYPEEGLVPYPLDSQLMSTIDRTDVTRTDDELRDWQDPSRVKWLVAMDQTKLLMLFYVCVENTRENKNRCAEILAEIVFNHSSESVLIDGKQQELLNEADQRVFILLLNRLYSLTETEKLALNLAYEMQLEVSVVKARCNNLEVDNEEFKADIKAMKEVLAQLSALLLDKDNAVQSKVGRDNLIKKHRSGLF